MDFQQMMIKDIQDLYQAESEQSRQLPQLMQHATSPELKTAFEEHVSQTQQQISRLQQILQMVGETPGGDGVVTPGVQGLVSEANQKMSEIQDGVLRDLALIAAAQKMEHYEMACYGTARAMARSAGLEDAARLLQETLDEEEATDKRLTQIALPLLKQVAPEEVTPA